MKVIEPWKKTVACGLLSYNWFGIPWIFSDLSNCCRKSSLNPHLKGHFTSLQIPRAQTPQAYGVIVGATKFDTGTVTRKPASQETSMDLAVDYMTSRKHKVHLPC